MIKCHFLALTRNLHEKEVLWALWTENLCPNNLEGARGEIAQTVRQTLPSIACCSKREASLGVSHL